ncbi:hypothetical protein HPB51_009006 [Rhipicephalus microplus]|uniref:Uncharacterized protein n=1 Tax=Rhipicephalus microplus TaxID=6941 RepID=A0A9J6D494_RHIMP|nr:hypothetical protein HPB51_009006 [Rhipicephalus microplus]
MKYGGSAVRLAREIAKAVDPLGTTVNECGENVTWWGLTLSADYNHRLSCQLGQAAGHRVMGIFPWIPALEVSVSAYKAAVQQLQGSGPSVQDLRV